MEFNIAGRRRTTTLILLMAFALVALASTTSASVMINVKYGHSYDSEDLVSEGRLLRLFEEWAEKHGKNYSAYEGEKQDRYQVFRQNLVYIHNHNTKRQAAGDTIGHVLGLNRFADLSLEEFKLKHLGPQGFHPGEAAADHLRLKKRQYAPLCDESALPEAVDWRDKGAVTPVKDQGQCGSCWAFSSTGAIEGAHAIANGELISLSEQELVSCSKNNHGCNGGLMDEAFDWVLGNGGINSEHAYPYLSANGYARACNWLLKRRKVVAIDSYLHVMPDDEAALMCAVSQQPVSVAIDAGTRDFQLYSEGVFAGSCSDNPDDIDHAVLAVGYGTADDGQQFWIVKNSWSESWGMDGYIHILRGSGSRHGVCAIHSFPSYPVVKKLASAKSSDDDIQPLITTAIM